MSPILKLDNAIEELKGLTFILDCMLFADEAGSHKYSKEGIDLISCNASNILKRLEEAREKMSSS